MYMMMIKKKKQKWSWPEEMLLRGQAGWLIISLLFDSNLLTHRIGYETDKYSRMHESCAIIIMSDLGLQGPMHGFPIVSFARDKSSRGTGLTFPYDTPNWPKGLPSHFGLFSLLNFLIAHSFFFLMLPSSFLALPAPS